MRDYQSYIPKNDDFRYRDRSTLPRNSRGVSISEIDSALGFIIDEKGVAKEASIFDAVVHGVLPTIPGSPLDRTNISSKSSFRKYDNGQLLDAFLLIL